jgi:hypothetical protein
MFFKPIFLTQTLNKLLSDNAFADACFLGVGRLKIDEIKKMFFCPIFSGQVEDFILQACQQSFNSQNIVAIDFLKIDPFSVEINFKPSVIKLITVAD